MGGTRLRDPASLQDLLNSTKVSLVLGVLPLGSTPDLQNGQMLLDPTHVAQLLQLSHGGVPVVWSVSGPPPLPPPTDQKTPGTTPPPPVLRIGGHELLGPPRPPPTKKQGHQTLGTPSGVLLFPLPQRHYKWGTLPPLHPKLRSTDPWDPPPRPNFGDPGTP